MYQLRYVSRIIDERAPRPKDLKPKLHLQLQLDPNPNPNPNPDPEPNPDHKTKGPRADARGPFLTA
jgi:hypothetical protein